MPLRYRLPSRRIRKRKKEKARDGRPAAPDEKPASRTKDDIEKYYSENPPPGQGKL